ncbi:unnamed protein product, partial [marine sediment metagenome]
MYNINPKFSLKTANKDGRSLISIRVAYNNTEFIYSTGEKISPEYWDNKKTIDHGKSQTDRVILPRGEGKKLMHQENKSVLHQLKRYEEAIYVIFDHCRMGRITPDNEYLKEEMDKVFKVNRPKTTIDFLSFVEITIQETKEGKRLTRDGKHMDITTIKGYTTTLNHLKTFHKKKRIRVDYDINMKFYRDFVSYFQENKKSINTIGKNIKNLKVFLKEAYNRGLTDNRIFEDPDFRIIE